MKLLFCRAIRTTLSARVLDTGSPPALMEPHVARCLRCQAVTAQTLRLRRTLARIEPRDETTDVEVLAMSGKWLMAGLASVAAALVASRIRQSASD